MAPSDEPDERMVPLDAAQVDGLRELEHQMRLETRVVYADRLRVIIDAYEQAVPASTDGPYPDSPA